MRLFILCFEFGPILWLALILYGLLRRHLWRTYSLFCLYVVSNLTYFVVGAAIYVYALSDPVHRSVMYLWTVNIGLAIVALFEFGVFYELADRQLFTRIAGAQKFRSGFRVAIALVILVAASLAGLLWRPGLSRVTAILQGLDFTTNLVKVSLLLAFVLLTRTLGISWRGLPAGIALGFGISAAAELSASPMFSLLHPIPYITIDLIRTAALHVCLLIWLVYVFLRDKPARATGVQMSELEVHLQELQRMTRH